MHEAGQAYQAVITASEVTTTPIAYYVWPATAAPQPPTRLRTPSTHPKSSPSWASIPLATWITTATWT